MDFLKSTKPRLMRSVADVEPVPRSKQSMTERDDLFIRRTDEWPITKARASFERFSTRNATGEHKIVADGSYYPLISPGRRIFRVGLRVFQCLSDSGPVPAQSDLPQKPPQQTKFDSIFCVVWSPVEFSRMQLSSADQSFTLGCAVTVTGTNIDAQTLSCREYLQQTWPTSGLIILNLVEEVIKLEVESHVSCQCPDGTKLIAYQHGKYFMLRVTGSIDAISQVGDQIAWMASGLRSPPTPDSLAVCKPSIFSCGTHKEHNSASVWYSFHIDFYFEQHPKVDVSIQGGCWHSLFGEAMIVGGYPISPRPQSGTGLEISLQIMAYLVGTKYLNRYDGAWILKGFSSMLICIKKIDDIVLWHLCHAQRTDQYLSLNEHGQVQVQQTTLRVFEKTRHIVGWSSNVASFAGTVHAKYNVRATFLRKVPPGSLLDGCKLSPPRPIRQHGSFTLTSGQKTACIFSEDYSFIFRRLANLWVLFFDIKTKRGWLYDGISSLLHLVFASIMIDEQQAHGSKDFHFDWSKIEQPWNQHGPGAARRLLGMEKNRQVRITTTRDVVGGEAEYELLSDRMVRMFHVLNKMFEYQQKTRQYSPKPRGILEGWDFHRIVSQRDSSKACAVTLDPEGKTWANLILSIKAVTIFGNDYGELMRPSQLDTQCSNWHMLPHNKSYIAVRISDLKAIMEELGDIDTHPPMLTRSILWHSPVPVDGPCSCTTHSDDHSGIVQVLWPRKGRKDLNGSSVVIDFQSQMNGAVVFGHNQVFGWCWDGDSDPIHGLPLKLIQKAGSSDEIDTDSSNEDSTIPTEYSPSSSYEVSESPNTSQQYNGRPGKAFGNSFNKGGSNHFGDSIKYEHHHHYPAQQYASPTLTERRPDMLISSEGLAHIHEEKKEPHDSLQRVKDEPSTSASGQNHGAHSLHRRNVPQQPTSLTDIARSLLYVFRNQDPPVLKKDDAISNDKITLD